MSHWTTSGRSRLKAKQNQSFSFRARQRAAVVPRSGIPLDVRRPREAATFHDVQSHHNGRPSQHRAFPTLLRRGIVVSIGDHDHEDRFLQNEKEPFRSQQTLLPSHQVQQRRIRDPSDRYASSRTRQSVAASNIGATAGDYDTASRYHPRSYHYDVGQYQHAPDHLQISSQQHLSRYEAPPLSRRRHLSVPRKLFPPNDENLYNQRYDPSDQGPDSYSHSARKVDNNTLDRRFGSRMSDSRYVVPRQSENLAEFFDPSGENKAMRGIPRFQRQKAERVNSSVDPPFPGDPNPSWGGQKENLSLHEANELASLDPRRSYTQDPWMSGHGRADWEFEKNPTAVRNLSEFEAFDQVRCSPRPETRLDRLSSFNEISLTWNVNNIMDPSQFGPPTGGLQRFQKRKRKWTSPPKRDPHFVHQIKTQRYSLEFDDGLLPRTDEGEPSQQHVEDPLLEGRDNRHASNLLPSSWRSTEIPQSPSHLRFFNEGEEIDLFGQPVMVTSPAPIPKGHFEQPNDPFRETSLPEFLF